MKYLLAILMLATLTIGLTIVEPSGDITTPTEPVSVDASWNGASSTYHVLLTNSSGNVSAGNETGNSTSFSLYAGSYTLTVTGTNDSDSFTFDVINNATPTPPVLTISTNKALYEVSEPVHLTATTDTPTNADLVIERNGVQEETYTLSLTDSITLIYIPDAEGDFDAILSAGGASETASFTVEAPTPLTADFTYDSPIIVNEASEFTAQVSGGEAPYTYQWLFSDNTASSGNPSTHYFFSAGAHDATLIVTDNEGTQQSITKNFTVEEARYTLSLTVQDITGIVVPELDVTLVEPGDSTTIKTNGIGTAVFSDVVGTYQLLVERTSTVYYDEEIEITEDTNMLVTINYTGATTNTSNATTNETAPINTTNTTNVTINETPTNTTNETEVAEVEPVVEEILEDPEPTALEALQEEKLTTLSERKFNLRLSAKKDRVLSVLGLYKLFDEATQQIQDATSEATVVQAIGNVPLDVEILDESTQTEFPDSDDIDEYIDQYFESLSLDKDEEKSLRYSIKQLGVDVSVRTTRTQATVTYPDRKETHTIVQRTVRSPGDSYTIEIIPKEFAASVSDLLIQGDYEIIESDPVLKFTSAEYTYSAEHRGDEQGYALVVPEELQEPPLLSGFFGIEITSSNATRSLVYLFITGIFVVGLIAGTRLNKKKQTQAMFTDFATLADQAITMIHDGQQEQAAHITPDIVEIYGQLTPEHQVQLTEVIDHLKLNVQEQHFLVTLQSIYENVSEGEADINHLSASYEHILTAYEALPGELQERLKDHIEQLDAYLDYTLET